MQQDKSLNQVGLSDVFNQEAAALQLNKQENSNKFGKAVFHGNNREFRQGTKEEQMIAEGCKRLIENSVICWNYLYLSQLISDAKTDAERKRIGKIDSDGFNMIKLPFMSQEAVEQCVTNNRTLYSRIKSGSKNDTATSG